MSDEIRMDYGLMEDMSSTFSQGVEQLQDTVQSIQNIANEMEDGALLGQGGAAFVDALRGKLTPRISSLIAKFEELTTDINKAMDDMRTADEISERMF